MMKKLLIPFLLILSHISFGQIKTIKVQGVGGVPLTMKVDSCTSSNDSLYYWVGGAKTLFGLNTNFANTDLTATGDRTHDFNGHNLNIVNANIDMVSPNQVNDLSISDGGFYLGVGSTDGLHNAQITSNDSSISLRSNNTNILNDSLIENYINVYPSRIEFISDSSAFVKNTILKIKVDSSDADPNNVAYFKPDNTLARGHISTSGGSTDTTYLRRDIDINTAQALANYNAIQQRTDSLRNNAGVLEARKGGVFVPQFTLPTATGCPVTYHVTPDSLYLVKDSCGIIVDSTMWVGVSSSGLIKYSDTATMLAPYQHKINLTTTGSSGASTFNQATGALNIPSYAGVSGGGIDSIRHTLGTDSIKQYSLGVGTKAFLMPRVFNVKSYGANPDGIADATASISALNSTLTTTKSIFKSGDVGKIIVVVGAGTSGQDLKTTISAYTSGTSVTLTAPAATTVSNQTIVFGTDQTTFIQSAINASYNAGGGTVYIPNGVYLINGGLQTINGIAMNSQLYIPTQAVAFGDSSTHIQIIGETVPNFSQYGWANFNGNKYNGVVLLSTLTNYSSGAAIIGTNAPTSAFGGHINYTYLTVKNLNLKVLDNPAGAGPVIGGVSYRYGASVLGEGLMFCPIGIGAYSVQPTNDVSAFESINYSSETMSHFTNCVGAGVKNGFMIGDHTVLDQCQAFICYNGFNFKLSGGHDSYASRILSQWSTNDIYFSGANMVVYISDLDVEKMTSFYSGGKWFDNVYTVNDPSNLGQGSIHYSIAKSGGGMSAATINGAINLVVAPKTNPTGTRLLVVGNSSPVITPVFTGFPSSLDPVLEVNSKLGSSVSQVSLVGNQSGTASVVSQIIASNGYYGGADKRIAQISFSNDGATNSGNIVLATVNAGTLSTPWIMDKYGNLSNTGIDGTSYLHLRAGTATVGTAPIKLTAGVVTTTPVSGQIETNSTNNLFYTDGTAVRGAVQINKTTGTAQTQNIATLVAGTVTVSTTAALTGSNIQLTVNTAGGTQGFLSYTIVNGTSFTITSTSATETSTVGWVILNQ